MSQTSHSVVGLISLAEGADTGSNSEVVAVLDRVLTARTRTPAPRPRHARPLGSETVRANLQQLRRDLLAEAAGVQTPPND